MRLKQLTITFILTWALLVLNGCGSVDHPEQYFMDNYQLVNTKTSKFNPDDMAKVYRIPKPPNLAAEEIAKKVAPDYMSESSNERMLLVYPELIIDITADPQDPAVSVAEVASKEFVANNYSRDHFDAGDFMTGYLAAEIIDEVFDVWKYKNTTGSIRKGSTFRGGGPAAGK